MLANFVLNRRPLLLKKLYPNRALIHSLATARPTPIRRLAHVCLAMGTCRSMQAIAMTPSQLLEPPTAAARQEQLKSTQSQKPAKLKYQPKPVINAPRKANILFRTIRAIGWSVACTIRVSWIVLISTPMLIALPFYFILPRSRPTFHWLFRWTLETLGPTFIKLGQWAATRPDIFPQEMSEVLGRLHNSVPTHSMKHTMTILKQSCGDEFLSYVNSIDPNPIGSGCIAQVHQCRLKLPANVVFENASDRIIDLDVAIKIMHPGVKHLIEMDVSILSWIAGIVDALPTMHWLSLPDEAIEFKNLMQAQLDLRLEAMNLVRFQESFKDDDYVHFPTPFTQWCTEQVLVEEHIDGVPILGFVDADNEKANKRIAGVVMESFLQMILRDNFVHADLHPGNIIIQLKNYKTGQVYPGKALYDQKTQTVSKEAVQKALKEAYTPHIVFIDAGLVTTLTEENGANFLDLFTAVADGDGKKAARLMVDRSRLSVPKRHWFPFTKRNAIDDTGMTTEQKRALRCKDYPRFEERMVRMIDMVQSNTFQLASVQIGDTLTEVLSLVRQHHVLIESDFTNLVVSIMVLEGLGRKLDPDVDLFEAARPLLRYRETQFYAQRGGVFFKLSAFLETRYWLRVNWDEETYAVVDTLIWNNF